MSDVKSAKRSEYLEMLIGLLMVSNSITLYFDVKGNLYNDVDWSDDVYMFPILCITIEGSFPYMFLFKSTENH